MKVATSAATVGLPVGTTLSVGAALSTGASGVAAPTVLVAGLWIVASAAAVDLAAGTVIDALGAYTDFAARARGTTSTTVAVVCSEVAAGSVATFAGTRARESTRSAMCGAFCEVKASTRTGSLP